MRFHGYDSPGVLRYTWRNLGLSVKFRTSFDGDLEREFRRQDFRESIRIIRFGLVLGTVLYGLFGFLDQFMLPVTKEVAWTIRYAIVLPVLVAVIIASFQKSFIHYYTAIIFITSLILAFGILGMIYCSHETESGATVYYTGLMLVIIWIGTFSQLHFKYASISIGTIILAFLLISIFRHDMIRGGFINPKFITFINNGFFFISSAVLALVSSYAFELVKRHNFLQRKNIESEKRKSDKLLLNILPESVAEEIKKHGTATPQVFPNVTVLFSDIVGFTELAAELEPEVLIETLNEFFTNFDNIMLRNQCERIKTIGDAYLAVSGMPREDPLHAIHIATAALECIEYCRERNRSHPVKLEIRIGIHTGKVVGAVVGIRKYIYDVFGATINTTSRMQSHSAPMRINLTETTYDLIKDHFICSERNTIPVKGLGNVKMYYLEGANKPAEVSLAG